MISAETEQPALVVAHYFMTNPIYQIVLIVFLLLFVLTVAVKSARAEIQTTEITLSIPAKVQTTYVSALYAHKVMADGSWYTPSKMTCASNDYPLGTYLLVTYDGHSVLVVVRDRMAKDHCLDLSEAAFAELTFLAKGRIHATVRRLHHVHRD